MRNLTARNSSSSVLVSCRHAAIGTCRLFLSDRERFSEVYLSDPETARILRIISDEVRAYKINRSLFKECPASFFYSEPYLAWYNAVLGGVSSDSENYSFPVRFPELNRSFALTVLSAETVPGQAGVHLTLLLPPMWRVEAGSPGIPGAGDSSYSHDSDYAGLCLLQSAGCDRWTGKLLQGEHKDGFRRLFSPEAV